MNATPYMHPDQKPFPDLKNMKEREAFLQNYEDWPVWCRNELTEETFYRYDLPDGSAIVVRSYPYIPTGWKGDRSKTRIGQVYYLLNIGEKGYFEDCKSNITALKDHLSRLRKEKK